MFACKVISRSQLEWNDEKYIIQEIAIATANWSDMVYAGSGVKHYQTYPEANCSVADKSGLSGSEWTGALKLNCGYANLAGNPEATSSSSSRHCRPCNGEIESIRHVLGACDFGANRRKAQHHRVKHTLAKLLTEKGYREAHSFHFIK